MILAAQAEPIVGRPVELPTLFVSNRFVVTPETVDGVKMRLYTDSAGGMFLTKEMAERLHGEAGKGMAFPKFKPGKSIPPPIRNLIFAYDMSKENDESDLHTYDGMLGQQWFGG